MRRILLLLTVLAVATGLTALAIVPASGAAPTAAAAKKKCKGKKGKKASAAKKKKKCKKAPSAPAGPAPTFSLSISPASYDFPTSGGGLAEFIVTNTGTGATGPLAIQVARDTGNPDAVHFTNPASPTSTCASNPVLPNATCSAWVDGSAASDFGSGHVTVTDSAHGTSATATMTIFG